MEGPCAGPAEAPADGQQQPAHTHMSEPQRVPAPAFELPQQTPRRAEISYPGHVRPKLQIQVKKKKLFVLLCGSTLKEQVL